MEFECKLDQEELVHKAREGGFFSYACGVAAEIISRFSGAVGGIRIDNYKTDLPIGKGLSSSAAICVLVARAFSGVYGLGLSVQEEMDIAYQGEIKTPSRCGRMDQCCAFGNKLVLMNFDGKDVGFTQIEPIALKKDPLFLVIVDLKGTKDTKKILSGLNVAYPFPTCDLHEGIHYLLGEYNELLMQNVLEAFKDEGLGAKRIGELMNEAQIQFDRFAIPACPDELTAPKLHKILEFPQIQGLIWGGKGVGSQGDGCAQFVCRDEASQQLLVEILENNFGVSTLKMKIELC